MALIGMAVYSTEENKKDECLERTLESLYRTVDFTKHRLMLSVNAATEKTRDIIVDFGGMIEKVFHNGENLGTAEAINKVIHERRPGENVVKIDDDVLIHQSEWVDLMDEAIQRDNKLGICGLKRKDLIQCPTHPDPTYRSEFILLPHNPGEKWIIIERTEDIIGTATMFNSLLLDKVGYSRQPGCYGFEDNLLCHRSHLAGFYNCFLPHIEIDHIDPGGGEYEAFKKRTSGEKFAEYHKLVHDMIAGRESIYYNPFE